MKKTFLIIAALAAPVVSFAQGTPRPISLSEAVSLAKKNSPSTILARGLIRTSAAQVTVSKWAFGPQLTLNYGSNTSGGGQYVNGQLITQANRGYSFSQSLGGLSMTLWDGGSKLATLHESQAAVVQAEATEVANDYSVVSNVKSQYYSVLSAKEQEASAALQLQQAQQQMDIAVAKLQAGTATTADTLTASIAVGDARLAQLSAKNNEDAANAQLTRSVATDFAVTAVVADTTDPVALQINVNDLYVMAAQGPSVRQSVASLDEAKQTEKVRRAILWPQVTLSGNYSRNNSDINYDFGAGPMGYSWTISLNASFTVWNNYQRESNILSAKIATDNADATLRDTKLLATENITIQLAALRTAEASLRVGEVQLNSAKENLRVATVRYQLGTGALIDVTTAQTALNSARTNLIGFRFNARNARAQLEAVIGRDLQ